MRCFLSCIFLIFCSSSFAESYCKYQCELDFYLDFAYGARGFSDYLGKTKRSDSCQNYYANLISSQKYKGDFALELCAWGMGALAWSNVSTPKPDDRLDMRFHYEKYNAIEDIRNKRYELALLKVNGLLDIYPQDVGSLILKGDIFLMVKNYAEARESFFKAENFISDCADYDTEVECYSFDKEMVLMGVFASYKETGRLDLACLVLQERFKTTFRSFDLQKIYRDHCS